MSVFSVPPNPTEGDIADALSMSIITGLQARALSSRTRLSLEEAYLSARRFAPEVARAARGLLADARDSTADENLQGLRAQAATALMGGLVAGMVARREPVDEALLKLGRMREKIWPAAHSLVSHPHGAAAAVLAGGALQGCVAAGQTAEQAMATVRPRYQELSASAAALAKVSIDQFGEEGMGERLVSATQLYATAVAGLMSRGESLSDALVNTRRSRDAILAKTASTPTPVQPVPTPPSVEQWRAGKSQASSARPSSTPPPFPSKG